MALCDGKFFWRTEKHLSAVSPKCEPFKSLHAFCYIQKFRILLFFLWGKAVSCSQWHSASSLNEHSVGSHAPVFGISLLLHSPPLSCSLSAQHLTPVSTAESIIIFSNPILLSSINHSFISRYSYQNRVTLTSVLFGSAGHLQHPGHNPSVQVE